MSYNLKHYFEAKRSNRYNTECKACSSPAFESLFSYICSNPNCCFYKDESSQEEEGNAICPICKQKAYQGLGAIICMNRYCERNKGDCND